jgi:hypothetical protein
MLFNRHVRPVVPEFRVRPQNGLPGFHFYENNSASERAWPDGMPARTLTARPHDAAQALAQQILGFPTPSPEFLAQPALPTGLPRFRVRLQDEVPGFRLEDAVPGFNLIGSGESAPPQSSDTAPAPMPPGMEDSTRPVPPQLPAWLYKLATMPLPQSSTAVDPRIGRPQAPLTGPVRPNLTTDQNTRGTEGARPYVDGISPPSDLDSVKATSAEQWLSSDTEEQPRDFSAATTQNTSPQPTAQHATWNTRLPRLVDRLPHTEASGAKLQNLRRAGMVRLPTGPLPPLSVRPVADHTFILANAGDDKAPVNSRTTPVPDLLGPVVGSIDASTGNLAKFAYLPYGQSAAAPMPFGFTGRRLEPQAGASMVYSYSPGGNPSGNNAGNIDSASFFPAPALAGTDAHRVLLEHLRSGPQGERWSGNVGLRGLFGGGRPDLLYALPPDSLNYYGWEVKPVGQEAAAAAQLERYISAAGSRVSAGNNSLIFQGAPTLTLESNWFLGRTTYTYYPGASGVVTYSVNDTSVFQQIIEAFKGRPAGAPSPLPLAPPLPRPRIRR